MSLTAQDVAEIRKLLEGSVFDELALEIGDLKIRMRRNGAPVRWRAPVAAQAEMPAPPEAPAEAPAKPAEMGVAAVPSPLLGIFYHAPKPGAAPFVAPGQRVEEDTIIGIVEVMKLMNTVRAGVCGEVIEVVAPNAAAVEYGDTLIRVRTD